MGQRGPAKKPTALEIAEGNPGKRRINDREAKPQPGMPDMPPGMSGAAKKIWWDVIPLLLKTKGLLTILDGHVIADFCEVCAEKNALMAGQRAFEKRALQENRNSEKPMSVAEVKASAFIKFADPLAKLRHRENVLRREIGLSASARSSIRIGDDAIGTNAEVDSIDEHLSRRANFIRVG